MPFSLAFLLLDGQQSGRLTAGELTAGKASSTDARGNAQIKKGPGKFRARIHQRRRVEETTLDCIDSRWSDISRILVLCDIRREKEW